ncbi:putative DEAD/DEAH box RNA helicase [Talaromyces proteolyticus]|uniref:RNA helicase n=1 Tax=Talaromyces proteolyticus TaxID=1131652 RepID=A0AAD4KKF0_9EURO|nr:putative DEAD/DEAH box RNA helicase [Talaromyces proteolyticus]KAH8690538.1 putative DEAD/DEAH box RNA helicase [Talaromyces proteolyticus]
MDTFDTEELAAALPSTDERKSRIDPAAAALAREKGWNEPEKYDYAKYGGPAAKSGEDGEATEDVESSDDIGWASSASRYEWKEEYGDVGPEDKSLEAQLFRSAFINRVGVKFENIKNIQVTAESSQRPAPITSFEDAGLHPAMQANVRLCGYRVPTPIQAYAIPAVLTGHDLIAVAQTGSGKTAAFFIPVLSKLMGKAKKLAAPRPNIAAPGFALEGNTVRAEPLVLVIVPTRELAYQIFDEARRLCYRSMLRPCVVYGGGPVRNQQEELQKGCDILIGTPGRLIDFMGRPHVLSLNRVRYTIIDEADELLHSDWEAEFSQLLAGADANEHADHRYMMFSATFNKYCRQLARKFLSADHVRIRVGRVGSTHVNIQQRVVFVTPDMKKQCLYDLLLSMPPARTLIFVNTKNEADLVDDYLYNKGLPSTSIHSERTQREREDAMRAFRKGQAPILVATGVSARGLDVKLVMHVINYDLPSADHGGIDEYVHRIGRTARIGNEGFATSLYNERNSDIAPALVKLLIEAGQEVPDFLEEYKPEGGSPDWHSDDTDGEGENGEQEPKHEPEPFESSASAEPSQADNGFDW